LSVIAGVDESGKGDFFGPLVVAALACDEALSPELTSLGARDSKLVADQRLLKVDDALRSRFPHVIIIVPPAQYNQRYRQIKNLNKLLADCHAEAIVKLAGQTIVDRAISDKFGKPELIELALRQHRCLVPLSQIVRGEAIPQVAAASVLARAAFLREMARLSEQYGMELLKGASAAVDKAGREFVKRHGINALEQVSKVHFKNYVRSTAARLLV
jgi:ribonuclease HIII